MADPAQQDVPAPSQMEVGGTGTATVSFTDVNGTPVTLASIIWTSTGPVTVTPSTGNPAIANLVATAPGRAHIRAAVVSESGASAEAAVEIRVIETGTLAEGKIDLTLQPPTRAQ
jgi:hypothetical protein